jgi:hypothetical protein
MYTPLPLLPGVHPTTFAVLGSVSSPYSNGMQAQMCIVEIGTGFTTFIDIGDGFVRQP